MDVPGKWTLDTTRLARRACRPRRRQAFACAASQGWIDRAGQRRSLDKLILDLNPGAPGVRETYGRRERVADQRRSKAVRCIALLGGSPRKGLTGASDPMKKRPHCERHKSIRRNRNDRVGEDTVTRHEGEVEAVDRVRVCQCGDAHQKRGPRGDS